NEKLIALGGGGQVSNVGHSVTLGGSTAGSSITVSVGGSASVRIGMWFPFASVAAGQWIVAGPGSSTFQLNCNVLRQSPGCPEWVGQVVTITAEGTNGTFPGWVSFNPLRYSFFIENMTKNIKLLLVFFFTIGLVFLGCNNSSEPNSTKR